MVYIVSRWIFKVLLKILCKFEVTGTEHLPLKGPFIIASNHASFADPAVVGVVCSRTRVRFMAKKELFLGRRFGWWFKALNGIPVERESTSFGPLKAAIRALQGGEVIGIFPEGTRSASGSLQKAQPGIGFIAVKSGAPVIPMYISGTHKALPKGQSHITPSKVTARVGKAVDISAYFGRFQEREKYKLLGEKVMSAIEDLRDE